jgi:protein-tyrosine phosphatase
MGDASGMIDIHCHVLPGIDDGPGTFEEALALAMACLSDGICHIVATPHVFPGRFDNLRPDIENGFRLFQDLLLLRAIPLSLSFAGEVRLSAEIIELLESDQIPFLGICEGYRTVLLELPDAQIPLGTANLVRYLIARQIRPVLAHPERNKAIMENPERVAQLVDLGCYLQLTAGSLVGQFGQRVAMTGCYLLEKGWVCAVASDAHNLHGRAPRMGQAREWLFNQYGTGLADELTRHGPARLCGMSLLAHESNAD